jgi:hypothetical protein
MLRTDDGRKKTLPTCTVVGFKPNEFDHGFCRVRFSITSDGGRRRRVLGFNQMIALEDAVGPYACWFEASLRVIQKQSMPPTFLNSPVLPLLASQH